MSGDLDGRRYPPVPFVLDEGRVRAFARAIGHSSDGVPPTIVTVPEIEAGLANVVADPELGIDLSGVLHSEQEYEWHRALSAGETLTAEARIEGIRARGGMRFVTLRTELRDEAGGLVAEGRTTLIVREAG